MRRPRSKDQTPIKYFSFCQPEFEAEIFSAKCVIFDKFGLLPNPYIYLDLSKLKNGLPYLQEVDLLNTNAAAFECTMKYRIY